MQVEETGLLDIPVGHQAFYHLLEHSSFVICHSQYAQCKIIPNWCSVLSIACDTIACMVFF